MLACSHGHVECVQTLLEFNSTAQGACDLELINHRNETALTCMAYSRVSSRLIVKLLLEHKASPDPLPIHERARSALAKVCRYVCECVL
jgi:ankyrin repeat protein